jgi:hypothetical protein
LLRHFIDGVERLLVGAHVDGKAHAVMLRVDCSFPA